MFQNFIKFLFGFLTTMIHAMLVHSGQADICSIYIFISWKSQNSKLNRNRCGIFDFNWSVKFVWLMTFTVKFHSSEESRPQIQVVGIHNAGLKFDKKLPVFSSKALSFLEKLPKISLISAIWAHYLLHCLSIFSPLHCEYRKMAF